MFENDVDSIVKGLQKTMAKLQKLADHKFEEAAATADMIATLSDKCNCCRNEAARASHIADKIRGIVS